MAGVKKKIEVYSQERYFTVTGNYLDGSPESIEERSSELSGLFAHLFTETPADAPCSGSADPSALKALTSELEPHLDANAEPPADKLEALLTNDTNTRQTWERDRPINDRSASGWDLTMANAFVAASWSNIETLRGLIAYRRKHGDHPKLRA